MTLSNISNAQHFKNKRIETESFIFTNIQNVASIFPQLRTDSGYVGLIKIKVLCGSLNSANDLETVMLIC